MAIAQVPACDARVCSLTGDAQLVWTDDGRTWIQLAEESMSLHDAATAAMHLAATVEVTRAHYLKRFADRADAALRREYESLVIDHDPTWSATETLRSRFAWKATAGD